MTTSLNQYYGKGEREGNCKTFLVKMSFMCVRIKKKIFHINGFALSLALKQRLVAARKWPIHSDVAKKFFCVFF